MDTLENDKELSQKLTVYTELYINIIINEADELIANKKLDECETLLYDSLDVIPVIQNQNIKDKLDEVKNLKPVGLDTVHIIDSYRYEYKTDGITDSFGNTYTDVHLFDIPCKNPYAVLNLNNQFTTLKGSIVVSEKAYKTSQFFVNIYADDKLVYSKKGFTKFTGKIDFSAKVKNCNQLTINVGNVNNSWDTNDYVCIADAVLEKQ